MSCGMAKFADECVAHPKDPGSNLGTDEKNLILLLHLD
jgi:hypothetical protein